MTLAPGAGALPIDVPTTQTVSGLLLTADRSTFIGSSGTGEWIALDGSRAVVLVDRRLWIADIGGPAIHVLGGMDVDVGSEDVRALHFRDDTVAVLHDSWVDIVDVRDPATPRLGARHELSGGAAFIASDADRLIIAGDDRFGSAVWLSVVEIESPDAVRTVASASLPVDRLTGVFADSGYVGTNVVVTEDSEERTFWQIYRIDRLSDVSVVMEGPPSEIVTDMADGRMLTHGGSSLSVYDLMGTSAPILIDSWIELGHVDWSQLNGDQIRYLRICTNPDRIDCERIHDIAFPDGGSPSEIQRTTVPGLIKWTGRRAFCLLSAHTGMLHCTGEDSRMMDFDPHALAPDGDRRPRAACTDAALSRAGLVVRCGTGLFRLRESDDGALRIVDAFGLVGYNTRDILSTDGHLYVHYGGQVDALVHDGTTWNPVRLFFGESDFVYASNGWLVALDDRGGGGFHLKARPAELVSTTLKLGRFTGLDPAGRALVMDDAIYLRTREGDWGRVSLEDGDTLSIDGLVDGAILDDAVVDRRFAYRLSTTVGPGGTERREIHTFDLESDPPERVATLLLADAIDIYERGRRDSLMLAGDILYIDRGEGWMSRVDVARPRTPVLLEPFQVTIEAPHAVPLSDGRLALVGDDEVEVSTMSADRLSSSVMSWNRWDMTGAEPSVDVLGGRLYLGQAAVGGALLREQWIYDLGIPSTPHRIAHVSTESVPALGWDGRRLETIGDGGRRLFSSEFSETGDVEQRSTWCAGNGRCPPIDSAEPIVSLVSTRDTVFTLGASGTLNVFDRTVDGDPVHASSWRFDGLELGELHLLSSAVLMAKSCDGEVLVLDIRDFGAIHPLGWLAGLPGPVDAIVTNNMLAILAIDDRVLMLDFGILERPFAFANFVLDGPVVAVDADSSSIVVASRDRIWLFERPSAWTAKPIGFLPIGPVSDVAIHELTLYVAAPNRGEVAVLDNIRRLPIDGPTIWLPSVVRGGS